MLIKPAHILLVDDNRMDVELTLDAFKTVKLMNTVHVAYDGQEALDYLFGKGEYSDRNKFPLPDLILLDLKMPRMDGHEVLKQLKEDQELKTLPVVILTSSKEEGDRQLCYLNGANSYIVKPVSFDNFIKVSQQIAEYWLSLNINPPFNNEA